MRNYENGVLTLTHEDGIGKIVFAFNPETQQPFASEEEAVAYAASHPMPYAYPVEPVPQPRRVTKLAFRNRFTQAEKVTVELAGLDNPTAPMIDRANAAAVRASQLDVQAATFIDLDRPDTRGGVQQLEAAGILSPGRALEILDAPIQEHERA